MSLLKVRFCLNQRKTSSYNKSSGDEVCLRMTIPPDGGMTMFGYGVYPIFCSIEVSIVGGVKYSAGMV